MELTKKKCFIILKNSKNHHVFVLNEIELELFKGWFGRAEKSGRSEERRQIVFI